MSREYPDRPFVGILAVVRRGDRVLLVHRAIPPDQGKWGFPGGKLELGETVLEGAIRELAEETGIIADPVDVLTVLDYLDPDGEGRIRFHFVLVAVLADWREGEGTADADAHALGWFTLTDIQEMPTSASVEKVMRLALAR